ncbi:FAD-dependent thymidylate synthase [Armatimonas rosea]|uniref:Thymidylate synthase ThyX n=1 Tax=Armatimonas rosea TaxID=685828 RepID=A0A7W9W847_ARMRO|nr:FAD-dependent thymidylate synthase [Armatimonas rosea]MBB6052368.1 thymidylate synthase ThyX [Armatimonas rosea]
MRVTNVSLRPTEASNAAGRPALTPELLAATGARYSRSNEGLEAILARIDPNNLDKSVDGIFKMVDYGHASIADMTPVALFIDGISMWLAYELFRISPTAGGQESSTRYIKLDEEGLLSAEELGIPDGDAWQERMGAAFAAYREALAYWEQVALDEPERVRIPAGVNEKAAARMRRNFAFDRARYFLPVAVRTNAMLVQSARAWVSVCQHLLSHPLPEAVRCGERIREELGLSAPRLIKHARKLENTVVGLAAEQVSAQWHSGKKAQAQAFLDVMLPSGALDFAADLAFHNNRYAYIGEGLRRTAVRFGWDGIAFAEIRDLNRHRTGTKYCPLRPVGFYAAQDEHPHADHWAEVGEKASELAELRLLQNDPAYIYETLLGTQFPFEHTTTADKFLYEAELRTGTGAHYRYAKHLRDVLALWYEKFPQTKGLVLEGSAEPE